jgi:hypothetical protein
MRISPYGNEATFVAIAPKYEHDVIAGAAAMFRFFQLAAPR